MCECIQIIPVCLSVCLGSPTHNLRLCCCEWSCELLATGLSLRKMPRSRDPGEDREPLDGHAYLLASRMTKWLLQCLQMRLHTTLVKLFMLSLCQLCEHKTCSHDNVPCKQCLSAVSTRQSEWLRLQLADLITLPWVRVPLYERQLHGQYICILSPLAITCCGIRFHLVQHYQWTVHDLELIDVHYLMRNGSSIQQYHYTHKYISLKVNYFAIEFFFLRGSKLQLYLLGLGTCFGSWEKQCWIYLLYISSYLPPYFVFKTKWILVLLETVSD